VLIRPEQTSDFDTIRELTRQAFERVPISDGSEHRIIDALRCDGDLTLSLVAIKDDDVVGHVAFSPVTIGAYSTAWYGLGPIAVKVDEQHTGIGSALVQRGLSVLRETGGAGCVLIGDPSFYARFGFVSNGSLRYQDVPPQFVQCKSFTGEQPTGEIQYCPAYMPETGSDTDIVYAQIEALVTRHSAHLGAPSAMAHMDPPTPDIVAKVVGLNAAYNQNLLHPDVSPLASEIEKKVIAWLLPCFGMNVGHFCAGSTIANLTAIWCAREHGAKLVIASTDAHLSVAKAAHILGMDYAAIDVDASGKLNIDTIGNLTDACLVLTAGTTSRGAVDPLIKTDALWTHVDAAWAGPLRLTKHAPILNGIETADSIAVSAHKWLYQAKESAIVLFADSNAHHKISYGGHYLATPNVGLQGSRSAAAIPLMATLMHWGRAGLAERIERNVADAETLANFLQQHEACELKQFPETAVVNWRPRYVDVQKTLHKLEGTSSNTAIDNEIWIRQVAANPLADIDLIIDKIKSWIEI